MSLLQDVLIALENWLVALIGDFGVLGIVFASIIQAIIAPIPSELIIGLSGKTLIDLYGDFLGMVLAVASLSVGNLLGGIVCYILGFYATSAIGRRFVNPDDPSITGARQWIDKYGIYALIIGRLIPFIPLDGISYAAGITKLRFWGFFWITLLASLPRIFFFIYGYKLFSDLLRNNFLLALLFISVVIAGLLIVNYYLFVKIGKSIRQSNDSEDQEDGSTLVEKVAQPVNKS